MFGDNGLLLIAYLHRLFDSGEMTINPAPLPCCSYLKSSLGRSAVFQSVAFLASWHRSAQTPPATSC
ncbi:hypothetical protein [Serratia fonticola]